MIATADSRMSSRICATIKILGRENPIVGPLFHSKVNSRCPAIMFAVSRTARVPGRMMLLIVSMQTMNGINTGGVPCGTRCSNMWFVLLIHPNIMNLTHKGKAKVRFMTR
jgi:hypothetical protein